MSPIHNDERRHQHQYQQRYPQPHWQDQTSHPQHHQQIYLDYPLASGTEPGPTEIENGYATPAPFSTPRPGSSRIVGWDVRRSTGQPDSMQEWNQNQPHVLAHTDQPFAYQPTPGVPEAALAENISVLPDLTAQLAIQPAPMSNQDLWLPAPSLQMPMVYHQAVPEQVRPAQLSMLRPQSIAQSPNYRPSSSSSQLSPPHTLSGYVDGSLLSHSPVLHTTPAGQPANSWNHSNHPNQSTQRQAKPRETLSSRRKKVPIGRVRIPNAAHSNQPPSSALTRATGLFQSAFDLDSPQHRMHLPNTPLVLDMPPVDVGAHPWDKTTSINSSGAFTHSGVYGLDPTMSAYPGTSATEPLWDTTFNPSFPMTATSGQGEMTWIDGSFPVEPSSLPGFAPLLERQTDGGWPLPDTSMLYKRGSVSVPATLATTHALLPFAPDVLATSPVTTLHPSAISHVRPNSAVYTSPGDPILLTGRSSSSSTFSSFDEDGIHMSPPSSAPGTAYANLVSPGSFRSSTNTEDRDRPHTPWTAESRAVGVAGASMPMLSFQRDAVDGRGYAATGEEVEDTDSELTDELCDIRNVYPELAVAPDVNGLDVSHAQTHAQAVVGSTRRGLGKRKSTRTVMSAPATENPHPHVMEYVNSRYGPRKTRFKLAIACQGCRDKKLK
jgi:hypothetical protein